MCFLQTDSFVQYISTQGVLPKSFLLEVCAQQPGGLRKGSQCVTPALNTLLAALNFLLMHYKRGYMELYSASNGAHLTLHSHNGTCANARRGEAVNALQRAGRQPDTR